MIAANAPAVSAISRGLECEALVRASSRVSEKGLRLLFACLVGEPVLVVRHCPLTQRRNKSVNRHFVGIAEGEIADAGFAAPLAVTRASNRNPLRLRKAASAAFIRADTIDIDDPNSCPQCFLSTHLSCVYRELRPC